MHLIFEVGTTRYDSRLCEDVAVDEEAGSANISFKPSPVLAAVKASATFQGMTFEADTAGAGGNAITVALTTGATAGAEVVSVVGNAISVQVESGVSTRTQVKTALDAHGGASALINTTVTSGGTAVTAPVSATALSGGVTATAAVNYDLADINTIRRLRTRKWLIKINGQANPA